MKKEKMTLMMMMMMIKINKLNSALTNRATGRANRATFNMQVDFRANVNTLPHFLRDLSPHDRENTSELADSSSAPNSLGEREMVRRRTRSTCLNQHKQMQMTIDYHLRRSGLVTKFKKALTKNLCQCGRSWYEASS